MRESKPEFKSNMKFEGGGNIAIIVAKWNANFNEEMFLSVKDTLKTSGIKESDISRFEVPGAFEMPLICMHLAASESYDAIICLGTIIKGDTYHFEIVANESARGIMDIMLSSGIPIINGILACNTSEEAEIRASRQKENKGRELALSCLETLKTIDLI
ncbi:MAG: 6,7-dimethyl-8-ribityllumazine synthase [Candidatus Caenarcaniphilales bacterium]|jgi:6,7-dimethyl-8-ribityllumazine synthase|nr:6,7-dimethyl-8-ribityllumazine synthase [Candidatus Caenarcaniphilales bacterium]